MYKSTTTGNHPTCIYVILHFHIIQAIKAVGKACLIPSKSNAFSDPRHRHLVVVVDIVHLTFDPICASAKDAIPQASLFAVVGALLPALAVVQVVILDD